MNGAKLKLKLKGNRLFLTDTHSVSLSNIDLMSPIQSFFPNAYWSVKVISFEKEKKRIYVNMIGGGLGDISLAEEQGQYFTDLEAVSTINFGDALQDIVLKTCNFETKYWPTPEEERLQRNTPTLNTPNKAIQTKPISSIKTINKTVVVPFTDVILRNGYALVRHTFEEHPVEIELRIVNSYLREEFHSIKNYFANYLKMDTIIVAVHILIKNNEIISQNATSQDILNINESLLDIVKIEAIREAYSQKIPKETPDNIVTKEDFLKLTLHDKGALNALLSESELLIGLMDVSDTKHHKQLQYLSNIHQHTVMKLRFILNPFSFLFLIESPLKYHFIWETLDGTDATYIWSFIKDSSHIKEQYQSVEMAINRISDYGRNTYLKLKDSNFNRVIHDYSDPDKGFVAWKKDFERIIT